jgi:hypothetical protein
MKSVRVAVLLLLCGATVVACASEPEVAQGPGARSPEAATRDFFERIRDRDYGALYENASSPFREVNSRKETLTRLEGLDDFGQLVEARPVGEVRISGPEGNQTATMDYEAEFALGEGRFEVTAREDAASRTWRLDHYGFDVETTTGEPPYAKTAEGADRLAKRFVYLWQKRRYDDLAAAMRIGDDPGKVRAFFEELEGAGNIRTIERMVYHASKGDGVKAEYDVEFDRGSGYITFLLVPDGEAWRIDKVTYDVERVTTAPEA